MTHSTRPGLSGPILAALTAIAIWGATPAVTWIATRHLPPADVGLLRTVLSAALLLPVLLIWRLPFPPTTMGRIELAIGALAGFVAYPLLLSIGLPMTTTSHAALILAAPPVLTGLIGFGLARKPPPHMWIGGGVLALIGEALLVLGRGAGAASPASLHGDLLIALSVIVVSVGYVSGGRLAARIGTWAATGWAVVLAGLVLLPFSIGALRALPAAPLPGLWAMAFLVIGVTIIGYACWYYAIGVASPQRISPLQFGQPVISLVIAVALLAEPLTPTILMATALILTGVVLCRRAVS